MKAAMPFTISDLRQCPEFFDTVADRIWQAWWKAEGHPLDYISGRLRENMNATSVPFALVDRATLDCFALGVGRVYLCARPQRTAFYERLGWRSIERDVGPHCLSVF